jgi:cell division septation protein DedD
MLRKSATVSQGARDRAPTVVVVTLSVMVRRNRRVAALAALLLAFAGSPALSAPVAFGQSAGDDQYEDPFAGENESGQEEPAATPTPAPAEPAPAEPAPAAPTAESTPVPASPEPGAQPAELPRTGLDAAPVLAIGAVLLAGGVALRLRVRERH